MPVSDTRKPQPFAPSMLAGQSLPSEIAPPLVNLKDLTTG